MGVVPLTMWARAGVALGLARGRGRIRWRAASASLMRKANHASWTADAAFSREEREVPQLTRKVRRLRIPQYSAELTRNTERST